MKIAPCKNCDERAPTCHDSCTRFLEWAEMARSEREALNRDNRMANVVNDVLHRPANQPSGYYR